MIRRAKAKDTKIYPNQQVILSIPYWTNAGSLEEWKKALASFLFHQYSKLDAH